MMLFLEKEHLYSKPCLLNTVVVTTQISHFTNVQMSG